MKAERSNETEERYPLCDPGARESLAYEREFLRRSSSCGIWYAILSALLYVGSDAVLLPTFALVVALSLHIIAFAIRRYAWSRAQASRVANIAVLQAGLFGLFVALMLWMDGSPQTVALSMVSLCGVCTAGTNSMAIPPGRHVIWVVVSTLPALVALLLTHAVAYWPLGLTITAFSGYVIGQGQHVLRAFTNARRDAAQLRAASVEKRALVSHLSHDVRTPLAAVAGYMQLAQQSQDPDEFQHCVQTAELQLRSSLDLLNHLLDVAKMDFSHRAARITTFSPGASVLTTAALYRDEARQNGVELIVVATPPEDVLARGSALGLARSLSNLLSNAVRYTTEGSILVRLELRERGTGRHGIHLDVTDTGPGMPDDVVRHVQRVLRGQAPTPLSSRGDGDGLGLSGLAYMLRSLGGRIDIRTSEKGTSTQVWLPVSLAAQQASVRASA